MPMHDWTRVTPNDYHHFHLSWIFTIADALNNGGLPPDYYAMAEHVSPPTVPDVVTLATTPGGRSAKARRTDGMVGLAATAPRVRHTASAPPRSPRQRQRRLAVRRTADQQVVAVIEIVSPSNKAKRSEYADFLTKLAGLLRSGVHLLVIDPFPPTARDPHGLHPALWRRIVGRVEAIDPDRPLTAAAYLSADPYRAFVEPLAIGDRLPTMPLFLTPDGYVNLNLEPTYAAAWKAYPAFKRALVEGR